VHGCAIYDQRPEVCRRYLCAWMTEDLPEELKPSNCNFIVHNRMKTQGRYNMIRVDASKPLKEEHKLLYNNWLKQKK